jgi:ABC-2 type transporter
MADATTSQPTHAPIVRNVPAFNGHSVWAMYRFQMVRFFRTIGESLATPVITTALYFVVFGSAIGSRMAPIVPGLEYGSFLVPGLIMLSIFTNSIFNASFGIYFPKFTGTIYELLSAPVSYFEIVIAFVGAAATKSVILGLVILATAYLFVPVTILHPVEMVLFLILVSFAFSLFGFIIGIWAQSFEQLNFIPMHRRPAQPGRAPDLGLPLDLLRPVGRQRPAQPRRHSGLHRCLADGRRLDVQDGLPAQELIG